MDAAPATPQRTKAKAKRSATGRKARYRARGAAPPRRQVSSARPASGRTNHLVYYDSLENLRAQDHPQASPTPTPNPFPATGSSRIPPDESAATADAGPLAGSVSAAVAARNQRLPLAASNVSPSRRATMPASSSTGFFHDLPPTVAAFAAAFLAGTLRPNRSNQATPRPGWPRAR